MALGVASSIAIILILLALLYFFIRLGDAFALNRHRKKYKTYNDPSKKGGELREFERKHGRISTSTSNNEGKGDVEKQFLLPTDQIESGTEESGIVGGDKSRPKKTRVLRRRK
jgi:hypothetical protein